MRRAEESLALWEQVFGKGCGLLGGFSGRRPAPHAKNLEARRSMFFPYPGEARRALSWLFSEDDRGREAYFCPHLLTGRRRIKENAAPLSCLYADGDGAKPLPGLLRPTAVVSSSPGKEQFYFELTELVPPEVGERLNKRIALAMGADASGWDLTQLLRPPGTHNNKYAEKPLVRLLELTDVRHDPGELARLLPPEADHQPRAAKRAHRPEGVGQSPELSRVSPRMRDLIRFGNRGEYESRSEADYAACIAMFGAGYSEAEVWAAMTDPANGISAKFLEKGRDGERYLGLTVGKAAARAERSAQERSAQERSPEGRRGKVYARRKGAVRRG